MVRGAFGAQLARRFRAAAGLASSAPLAGASALVPAPPSAPPAPRTPLLRGLMVHKRSSSPADVPGDGSLAAEQLSPAGCQLPRWSAAAAFDANHRGGMLPLRPALLPKRYRGGSAPRSRTGRAAARAAAGGGGGGRAGGSSGSGAPALGPRGGVVGSGGAGRVPVRRRGPGSPRAARRGAEQELREPPRSCASWPVGAVATPRRGRGGGAGRGARPGRAAAALLLAQPAAAPAAVMAAVLSPRLCDSDPATPGAQSLKVRAGGGRGTAGPARRPGAATQQPQRREASPGSPAWAP